MPLTKIKALIFDVDGTLYRPIPELEQSIWEYWVKQISYFKKISIPEAERLYAENKKLYKSSTHVLQMLGLGDPFTIIKRAEKNQLPLLKQLLKPDRKLVGMIKKLRASYSLYTLRNGTRVGTRIVLKLLGIENRRQSFRKGYGPFDDILPTVELALTKPNQIVFQKALRAIGLNANEVAIIGDRVEVDLIPAKKLWMNTVWVSWGRTLKNYDGIDAVVETIYDCIDFVKVK